MMKFTETHEWVRLEGRTGTVGVTRHAQKELGEVVHVELPKVGAKVKAGKEICVIESTKAAADIYSPVSGKIVAVNETLGLAPDKINKDPEGEGWLFRIELDNSKEMDALLTLAQYKQYVG